MKKKIIIISIAAFLILLIAGATYSYFVSNANMTSTNQHIAKFIFNSDSLDHLEIPLNGLKPGDVKEYEFEVSNNTDHVISDVNINYTLSLLTPHYMPLNIELYKDDTLLMTCDESYERNNQNELVCETETQELDYHEEVNDSYKLRITFDSNYNSLEYANLIDYLNIEIRSYQKV